MENDLLCLCSIACIGFGAYGSAWVWRLYVLSPGPSLLRCNPCTPQAGVYMFTKNIVQYQMIYFQVLHCFITQVKDKVVISFLTLLS